MRTVIRQKWGPPSSPCPASGSSGSNMWVWVGYLRIPLSKRPQPTKPAARRPRCVLRPPTLSTFLSKPAVTSHLTSPLVPSSPRFASLYFPQFSPILQKHTSPNKLAPLLHLDPKKTIFPFVTPLHFICPSSTTITTTCSSTYLLLSVFIPRLN